jgi:hypothetical protein
VEDSPSRRLFLLGWVLGLATFFLGMVVGWLAA